jgi:hypothetical protein
VPETHKEIPAIMMESLRPNLSEKMPAGTRTNPEQKLDRKKRVPISVSLRFRVTDSNG